MIDSMMNTFKNFVHRHYGSLAVMAGITVLLFLPKEHRLTITVCGDSVPLIDLPVTPGDRFTVTYRHSVSGLPVRDVHTIDSEGTIILVEERFEALSAGMGHWPGHGRLTTNGTGQVIERIDRPIGDFRLRVGGKDIGHAILLRGRRYDLSSLVPGKAVTVSVNLTSSGGRLLDVLRTAPGNIPSAANGRPPHPVTPQITQNMGGIP